MSPATWPRGRPLEERLLVVDTGAETLRDAQVGELPRLLRRGDLLVVNDAATLPASLSGKTESGEAIEVRLAARRGQTWSSVVFGAGDWRTKTEARVSPPRLEPRDRIVFDPGLSARVVAVHSARWVDLTLEARGGELWQAIYRAGRPVQYAYARAPLPLWAVQTSYASRPWAMEMPSAGRPLTGALLLDCVARGIGVASLTHAAGLSSTGDADLDRKLPFPELSDIPENTAARVAETRKQGGRVIAVGTSVVRALEGRFARRGELAPGEAETDLVIGPGFQRRVADGLLTGMHEPTASHYALVGAFARASLVAAAHAHATREGYVEHEFGDSTLLLDQSRRRQ